MYRALNLVIPELQAFNPLTFETLGGGHCFFHAISNAFYSSYRTETLNGRYISRQDIVRKLRNELAEKLTEIDPETGLSYYEGIANGNLASLGKELEEFSLVGTTRHLQSNEPVGDMMVAFVSKILHKDIYIIDGAKGDVYHLPDVPKGCNPSVVVHYSGGHYEMVGLCSDGSFSTYFTADHPFIVALRNRLLSFKKD